MKPLNQIMIGNRRLLTDLGPSALLPFFFVSSSSLHRSVSSSTGYHQLPPLCAAVKIPLRVEILLRSSFLQIDPSRSTITLDFCITVVKVFDGKPLLHYHLQPKITLVRYWKTGALCPAPMGLRTTEPSSSPPAIED